MLSKSTVRQVVLPYARHACAKSPAACSSSRPEQTGRELSRKESDPPAQYSSTACTARLDSTTSSRCATPGCKLAWAASRRSTSSSRVPLTTPSSTVRVIPSALSPGVVVDFRFFRKDFTATSLPVSRCTAFATVAKAPLAIGPSVV